MVQRYDIEELSRNPFESYRCIGEVDDGEYVKYSDYEDLMLIHMAEIDLIKDVVSDFFDSLPSAGTVSWDLDKLNLLNQITAIAEGK